MGLGSTRRTVLVTGAAGFLGSHLVDRLLAEVFEVVGLDNFMTGDLGNLEAANRDPHFHLEIGDVRETLHVYAQVVCNMTSPASPDYQSDRWATLTTSVLGEHTLSRPCCRLGFEPKVTIEDGLARTHENFVARIARDQAARAPVAAKEG